MWYYISAIAGVLLILNLIERLSYLYVFKDSRILVMFNILGNILGIIVCCKMAIEYLAHLL